MAVKLTPADVMNDGPVIPVIVLADPAHAVPLARALVAGGIRILEVTLRTSSALASIEAIARDVPDAIVGAGTVRSVADAQSAAMAGARFAVSPGYTHAVGSACVDLGLTLLPGVSTASEIMAAKEDGYDHLKFFPAVPCGGTTMLSAWDGPFPDVTFCPTGGITPTNARDFLALPNVMCVGGSWLAPPPLVARSDWNQITHLAHQAVSLRCVAKGGLPA